MSKKTEQCFCQSYYDDENVLCDCTCGKCGDIDFAVAKFKEEFIKKGLKIINEEADRELRDDFSYTLGVRDFAKYLQDIVDMKHAKNGIGYYRNKFLKENKK